MKNMILERASVQFSCSVVSDSLRPMNCSTPGLPVHHQLPEFTQTHVHNQVSDAIQTSHPLSSPSPPAPNPSQHKGLFQWVNSSHEVAKVLEFQILHQSFQWTPRTDLLQNGLVGSPCSPRDSQESSPTPQFKSIIKGIGMYLILDLVSTFKHYSAFEKQPSTQIFMKKWNYIILQPPRDSVHPITPRKRSSCCQSVVWMLKLEIQLLFWTRGASVIKCDTGLVKAVRLWVAGTQLPQAHVFQFN